MPAALPHSFILLLKPENQALESVVSNLTRLLTQQRQERGHKARILALARHCGGFGLLLFVREPKMYSLPELIQ